MNQSYIFKKIFCLALTSFPRSRADVTVAVSTISSESEISIPGKFITRCWTKGIHCTITTRGVKMKRSIARGVVKRRITTRGVMKRRITRGVMKRITTRGEDEEEGK